MSLCCVLPKIHEFADGLNHYSAAIQALATVALVAITWWYAKLTRNLSRIAQGQLLESRAVRRDQAKERYGLLKALLTKIHDALSRVPESGMPQQKDVDELLLDYDEYQRELMLGSSLLPDELQGHIGKVRNALTTLKRATRGIKPLTNDETLWYARLPIMNIKEGCTAALAYLSKRTEE